MSVNIFKKADDKLITIASQYKSTDINISDIQQIRFFNNKSELPDEGEINKLYVTNTDGFMYIWNVELNKYNFVGSDSKDTIDKLTNLVEDIDNDLQWKSL